MAREVLRLAPRTLIGSLHKKLSDTRADPFMPGRIGMDAVQQQLRISPVRGPRVEQLNIGDPFCSRGLLDRRVELGYDGIPVRSIGHPGQRGRARFIHRREPDPAQEGRTRPGSLNERPDIGADLRRRRDLPPVHELGIVDARSKHDDILVLARLELGREPLAEIRRRLTHNAEIIDLLYLSTSCLWWQVVAAIIGIPSSNTLRNNS
jgi:hypothetical protein